MGPFALAQLPESTPVIDLSSSVGSSQESDEGPVKIPNDITWNAENHTKPTGLRLVLAAVRSGTD